MRTTALSSPSSLPGSGRAAMLPSVFAMSLCLVPQLTTRPQQVAVPAAALRLAAAPRAALTEEEISREKERRRLAAEGKGEVAEASAAALQEKMSKVMTRNPGSIPAHP